MAHKPKISVVEAVLCIFLALGFDILDFIPFISFFSGVIGFCVFQFYFIMKRVKSGPNIVANAIDMLPFLSWLPSVTAGVVVVILMDRSPRLARKLRIKGLRKKREGGEEVGALE